MTDKKKRILTGDRPTGKLHLGHYVGSLANRVRLQHDYESFIIIADVQALTTHWEKDENLCRDIYEITLDYLAAGRKGVEVADALGAWHYVAFLGQRPVGGGTLYPRGRMGGIYNLCTLPAYQRRGVATAVMRTCIADALELGCEHVGLTPTPMGRRLYQRLGFRDAYLERYLFQRLPSGVFENRC